MSSKIVRAFLGFLGLICLVGFLGKIFSGSYVLPQAFSLGSLVFHYYGLTMAAAVGVGWWLALRRAPRYGFTTSQADSFFQWLVAGGFVGARLYHVASSWQYYWQYPLDIVKVWQGGLSIFGGLFGGFVVIIVYAISVYRKNRGRDFYETVFCLTDWLVPSVVLGQIIGRFGNLFNYEAFGYPTRLPWKMFVPASFRPESVLQDLYFHPLFLYEAVGNAGILCLLLRLDARRERPAGSLFFLYLFLYNSLRFALEYLRVDSTFLWGFIRLNTLTSGVLCLVGMAGFLLLFSYDRARTRHPKQVQSI